MAFFHAGFSCDAMFMAVGAVALSRGIGLRSAYVTTGVLFLLLAGAVLRLRLPSSARTRKAVRTGATGNTLSSLSVITFLLTPVVLLAMVLI